MFVACERYKCIANDDMTKIVVFDTDDCTAEVVNVEEAEKLGVEVFNLRRFFWNGMQCGIDNNNLFLYLLTASYDKSFAEVSADCILRVGCMKTLIRYDESGHVWVNGEKIILLDRTRLLYFFLCRGWLIIRFGLVNDLNYWYTFAVCDDKTEQWSCDFQICTDKALAVTIDTVSEV